MTSSWNHSMEDRQPISHPINSEDHDAFSNQHIGLVYSVYSGFSIRRIHHLYFHIQANFLLFARLESWWWHKKTNTRIIIEIQTKSIVMYSITMIHIYIHYIFTHTYIYAKLCTLSNQSNTFQKYFLDCTLSNTCKFPAINMEVRSYWETNLNLFCSRKVAAIVNIIIEHLYD